MTIDQAKKFIDYVMNKKQNNYLSGDDFNFLAPIAQMSVLNDRLGNVKKYAGPGVPVPTYGFNVSQKMREDLRPLMVKPTVLTTTLGSITYPNDYLYYDSLTTSAGKIIKEATQDEIAILNKSVIKQPTKDYPYFVLASDKIYVYPLDPINLAQIYISYVRKPVDPKWNYTYVNSEQVYSSSGSQDFELGIGAHLEICAVIAQMAGLNIGMMELTQFFQVAQQEGK